MQIHDGRYEITTSLENFGPVHKVLEDQSFDMEVAEITAIPKNTVQVDEKHGKQLLRLMDQLEDHDDVQKAYTNFDISEEVLAAIEQNA